ncbi:MAG: hypothetical protein KJO07_01360, partial [Deltaproteobacteria bacterium]|nr:hypothetical protein [Deltaproteobacteria bacterium]
MDWAYQGLARALSDRPEYVLAEWLASYRNSSLRLPLPMADDELCRWIAPLLESLTEAFAPVPRADGRTAAPILGLVPGAADVREVEKAAAFLGGRLAAENVSGFDVAAVFIALRDALSPHCPQASSEVHGFIEWLTVLGLDALVTARERALQERTREELERGTPVVLVAPDVVAVFLIGRPDYLALDTIFGRLMLRVARVGARAVIVDASGLAGGVEPAVFEAVGRFCQHRKIVSAVPVLLAGTDPEDRAHWQGHAETATMAGSFET